MKLWTIQPKVVVDAIRRGETYVCNPSLSPHVGEDAVMAEHFVNAYNWISSRLDKVTPRPEGVQYPVWAWHTWWGRRCSPDLNHVMFEGTEDNSAILELDIPEKELLLTSMEMYNYVLNNSIAVTDKEWIEWEEKGIDDEMCSFKWFMERCRHHLELSWDKHVIVPSNHTTTEQSIQACFWKLEPHHVVSISDPHVVLET